jgi:hypothetical protein
MRTAAAHIILTNGQRPTSLAALEQAAEALNRLTGEPRLAGIRFTGYEPAEQYNVPTGARVARYEADYA